MFGSEGFVGKCLVAHLLESGHQVALAGREEVLSHKKPLGHVIYCIGVTGTDFLTQQFNVARAHVSIVAEVLEKCTFDSLLYLSSARMYEGLETTHESATFTATTQSISDFYNLSKLFGESIVLNCGVENTRVARVAYAVNMDEQSTNLIAIKAREALGGRVVFSAHQDSEKDYVLLDDIVSILPQISISGKERIYNVAAGINISTRQFAEILQETTGCTVEYRDEEPIRKPKIIDVSRIQNEFGFQATSVLDYARMMLSGSK